MVWCLKKPLSFTDYVKKAFLELSVTNTKDVCIYCRCHDYVNILGTAIVKRL